MNQNSSVDRTPVRRPNVIWFFGDQLRAQALGYRGDPNVRTPNIDNLAREGMRFDAAVAGAPWCCPFRAALLTGLYPHQCGVIRTPQALDPAIPTIAASFRAAGYHTAYVGKWHLDGSNAVEHYVPSERRGGFDYWIGYENNNNQHEAYVHGGGDEKPRRLPSYETDALTDLLIEHLTQHTSGRSADGDYPPFFAVLSVQPPHNPYVPPTNPSYAPSGRRPASIVFRPNVPHVRWVREQAALDLDGYYGMIENLDWNLGRLRDALRRLNVDRETWLIFFSDHGDMLGSHGQWHKSSPWEESIRIPFIVARGSGGRRGRTGRCDAVLNHVDIAPTTLGLCGIPAPRTMVGYDYSRYCLRPDASGAPPAPNAAAEPDSAFLQQIPRKFHAHTVNKSWRGVVMRDGWKYVAMPGQDWLLHHTAEDPYEMANLVHDSVFREQRRRCWRRLRQWIEETGDDFPLPPED